MGALRKETADQFRVSFRELARVKRHEPVPIDPYLIARAIGLVMRECTVRSAAGKPILWNDYRMILARADFELVRSLQGPLERDLRGVLEQEARGRQAELVGELRFTVVFDEADELAVGHGVVRVGFVPAEQAAPPVPGEMTVRIDKQGWAVAGEIAARAPKSPDDTMFVDDSTGGAGGGLVRWPGGQAPITVGVTHVVGRPHAEAPAQFVALAGAGPKVNKRHVWIALGSQTVRIGRLADANPVHVNGQSLAAGHEIEAALPAEVSLSHGAFVISVRRG